MWGVKENEEWGGGVFLCTAADSMEADIFESKLRSEGIPCIKKYRGASNFLEIAMGKNVAFPIDIYVPEETLEDARNIVVPIPLEECEEPDIEE